MAWVFRRVGGIDTDTTTVQTIEPMLHKMGWLLPFVVVAALGACTSDVPTPISATTITPSATVEPAPTPSPTGERLPTPTDLPTTRPTATTPFPTRTAAVVSTKFDHTCAVTTVGGLQCWGANSAGQLGDGTTRELFIPVPEGSTPVDVTGLTSDVAAVSAGGFHTCAVTTAGGLKCWGENFFGQLGDGTTTTSSTPSNVTGLRDGVVAVSAGSLHTCAITTEGGLQCWGSNVHGLLGDGTTIHRSLPVDVIGLTSGVASVAAGLHHTCAVTTAGGLKCWGYNASAGQLGDGTTTNRSNPVDVTGLTEGVATVAIGYDHACAVTTAGGLQCWGDNRAGQLGDGTTTNRSTPVDVTGLTSGVATVAAGFNHTCAITTAGGLQCWGGNLAGQLGDGTTTNRSTPVVVTRFTNNAEAVAAGSFHTCAITTAGGLQCWGENFFGQLGTGRSSPPDGS